MHTGGRGPPDRGYNGPSAAGSAVPGTTTMHYDSHQAVIDDLEARITTIRDSL